MYKQFLMAALCAAGLAAAGCSNSGRTEGASAGGGDNAPVRISVGSYNLNNLPFFIADAKGYFKDVGLEVKTENFAQGGSKVLQALVANSTDVAVGFYDHTIQMQAKGKDVVAFVLLSRNSGLVMAGREDATSIRPARRPSRARRSASPHRAPRQTSSSVTSSPSTIFRPTASR